VTVPRRDFRRLAEICERELGPSYSWQSYSTTEHYPHLFGKVIRNDTVLRHEPTAHLPYPQAVYIDVFPLDGRAETWWAILLQRLTIRFCRFRVGAGIKRVGVRRLLARLVTLIPRQWAIGVFEAMTRVYPAEQASMLLCTTGPYGFRRQSVPRDWFGAGASQTFEGMTLIGPSAWHNYLNQTYGDYMTPPPLRSRGSHHDVIEISLDGGGQESRPSTARPDHEAP